ncbi:rho guanine nucleotide exchange factor 10-like isoform X3 [Branchiostoma floridae]|uniref:Rho guanine nucleotide exchange factor 10-like isoform X3 n=1 Tax=Branchiostoma floridae TaxID=7739 RepID=A0A9J7MBX8_BRAFL|nr:rho guanine nucleotide exchange factor 10-like isoform X3 [Branchiostoma floridae]
MGQEGSKEEQDYQQVLTDDDELGQEVEGTFDIEVRPRTSIPNILLAGSSTNQPDGEDSADMNGATAAGESEEAVLRADTKKIRVMPSGEEKNVEKDKAKKEEKHVRYADVDLPPASDKKSDNDDMTEYTDVIPQGRKGTGKEETENVTSSVNGSSYENVTPVVEDGTGQKSEEVGKSEKKPSSNTSAAEPTKQNGDSKGETEEDDKISYEDVIPTARAAEEQYDDVLPTGKSAEHKSAAENTKERTGEDEVYESESKKQATSNDIEKEVLVDPAKSGRKASDNDEECAAFFDPLEEFGDGDVPAAVAEDTGNGKATAEQGKSQGEIPPKKEDENQVQTNENQQDTSQVHDVIQGQNHDQHDPNQQYDPNYYGQYDPNQGYDYGYYSQGFYEENQQYDYSQYYGTGYEADQAQHGQGYDYSYNQQNWQQGQYPAYQYDQAAGWEQNQTYEGFDSSHTQPQTASEDSFPPPPPDLPLPPPPPDSALPPPPPDEAEEGEVYDDVAEGGASSAGVYYDEEETIYEDVPKEGGDDSDSGSGWGSEEFEDYSTDDERVISGSGKYESVELPKEEKEKEKVARNPSFHKNFEQIRSRLSEDVQQFKVAKKEFRKAYSSGVAHLKMAGGWKLPMPSQHEDTKKSFKRKAKEKMKEVRHSMIKEDEGGDGEEDDTFIEVNISGTKHPPPTLPEEPEGLSHQQIVRRHILASMLDSEMSYINSLHRLIQMYEKPLTDVDPPIVEKRKVRTIFYKVREILQCHTMFQIALSGRVAEWDQSEKIGDVFVASFSKSMVLDVYSAYVNNFSTAMETVKKACATKPAFLEFLKARQASSGDRLSLYGLMLKPVQRFPQFILLLQDMLKNTPKGHPDRLSLQLALTQLETLAEKLNEHKRETETKYEVKQVSRNMNVKFATKTPTGARYMIRQDDMIQTHKYVCHDRDPASPYSGFSSLKVYNERGEVQKTKSRRLFMMNDMLVCATVLPRSESSARVTGGPRYKMKWSSPLSKVKVEEGDIQTLQQVAMATAAGGKSPRPPSVGGAKPDPPQSPLAKASVIPIVSSIKLQEKGRNARIKRSVSAPDMGIMGKWKERRRWKNSQERGCSIPDAMYGGPVHLYKERDDLLYDLNLVGQVQKLVAQFRGTYHTPSSQELAREPGTFNAVNSVEDWSNTLQKLIKQKDKQIKQADLCRILLSLPFKNGIIYNEFNTYTPRLKYAWTTSLDMARLALEPINNPGWFLPEDDGKMNNAYRPLLQKVMPVFMNKHISMKVARKHKLPLPASQVSCAIHNPIVSEQEEEDLLEDGYDSFSNVAWGYVWVCSGEHSLGQITIMSFQPPTPRVIESFNVSESCIISIEMVPGSDEENWEQAVREGREKKKNFALPTMWLGTENGRLHVIWACPPPPSLHIYSTTQSAKKQNLLTFTAPGNRPILAIKYCNKRVFSALDDGKVIILRRLEDGTWKVKEPKICQLDDNKPVTSLFPFENQIWCACGNRVHIIDAETEQIKTSFEVSSDVSAEHIVVSGVGVWVSLQNKSTIRLYHTETLEHLQDINVASTIHRMLDELDPKVQELLSDKPIHVTLLEASKGCLWVGTNLGVVVSLPLPRLGGVPLITGRGMVAYHTHNGPVRFITVIKTKTHTIKSRAKERRPSEASSASGSEPPTPPIGKKRGMAAELRDAVAGSMKEKRSSNVSSGSDESDMVKTLYSHLTMDRSCTPEMMRQYSEDSTSEVLAPPSPAPAAPGYPNLSRADDTKSDSSSEHGAASTEKKKEEEERTATVKNITMMVVSGGEGHCYLYDAETALQQRKNKESMVMVWQCKM